MIRQTVSRPRSRSWGGGKYVPQRKFCAFCADKVETIDYKDGVKLRRYISDRGKIEPRRRTGTCAKHQRALAIAIKRARQLAIIPYTPSVRRPGMPMPADEVAKRVLREEAARKVVEEAAKKAEEAGKPVAAAPVEAPVAAAPAVEAAPVVVEEVVKKPARKSEKKTEEAAAPVAEAAPAVEETVKKPARKSEKKAETASKETAKEAAPKKKSAAKAEKSDAPETPDQA